MSSEAEITKPKKRRRRSRRSRRKSLTAWCPHIAALWFSAGLGCLAAIGPPPWLRIDALWVQSNRTAVDMLFVFLVGAAAFITLGVLQRPTRLASLVILVLFTSIGWILFSDRLLVIGHVVVSRAMG